MIGFLWRMSRGHRLRPWKSPYLRWRIETYWGLNADRISGPQFRKFVWQHRWEMLRFLRWAARMEQRAKLPEGRPFTIPT
jgi:hypothetical protein